MSPFFMLMKKQSSITTTEIGRAIIAVKLNPIEHITHLNNKQINKIAGI